MLMVIKWKKEGFLIQKGTVKRSVVKAFWGRIRAALHERDVARAVHDAGQAFPLLRAPIMACLILYLLFDQTFVGCKKDGEKDNVRVALQS